MLPVGRPQVALPEVASAVPAPAPAETLLASLDERTALVLVGDPDQIPPVKPGSVFRELLSISKDIIPRAKLEGSKRVVGGTESEIVSVAARVKRRHWLASSVESSVSCNAWSGWASVATFRV